MTGIGLLLAGFVLVVTGLCCTVWAFRLSGRLLQISEATFKHSLLIALTGLAVNLAVVLAGAIIHVESITGVLSIVGFVGVIVVVKQLLALRFWQACRVTILGSALSLVMSLMVALPIRVAIVAPFHIPSTSKAMLPTVAPDDRVLVNKMAYWKHAPQRWDVAVFQFPPEPHHLFFKRVVGLPGESIEIREGEILINGTHITPPRLVHAQWSNQGQFAQAGQPFHIPANCYFVLGDTSSVSHDSRFCGCVPRAYFIGKAFFVYWPQAHMGEIQ